MKFCIASRLAFVLLLLLLLHTVATTKIHAFVLLTTPASTRTSSSSLRSVNDNNDDSEWYSPPPLSSSNNNHNHQRKLSLSNHATPQIVELHSHTDMAEFVSYDPTRVSIVLFHANWCKTCQKFQRLYQKLALAEADWVVLSTSSTSSSDDRKKVQRKGSIRMASLEWGANTSLAKQLGVTKLPTVYFYVNGQKQDGFSCGPSLFPQVLGTIQHLQDQMGGGANHHKLEHDLEQGSQLIQNVLLDSNNAAVGTTSQTEQPNKQPWWKRKTTA